ncbi:hypothetical protein N7510_003635 [Penicillium lagena]|uniref:uncharacterized protein n=1 Tax=Penicillium lagena TaxID=94218 RepID=UPI002541622A|nr:uncharacterized protein N7510_003635 [Penicillium lagena]KAJ5619651.1 hypothetical protein N7510_003635 [Penicillium lagena]
MTAPRPILAPPDFLQRNNSVSRLYSSAATEFVTLDHPDGYHHSSITFPFHTAEIHCPTERSYWVASRNIFLARP